MTSVSMPLAELGSAAVDALIARVDGSPGRDIVIRQPMSLIRRASVGPPPASTSLFGRGGTGTVTLRRSLRG
ncbi:MAG: hypothetical protein ACYCO9_21660 [Streptosporangiaceae bacterium]